MKKQLSNIEGLEEEQFVKVIARMVYKIQGSDKNQPKMTGLKEAVGTFKDILKSEIESTISQTRQEVIEEIKTRILKLTFPNGSDVSYSAIEGILEDLNKK